MRRDTTKPSSRGWSNTWRDGLERYDAGRDRRVRARRAHPSLHTGTDIVVDGGWFPSAPYLVTERSHHALNLMDKKDHLEEFLHHFR